MDPPGGVKVLLPFLGELHAAAAIQHQRPVHQGELPEEPPLELLRGLPKLPVRETAQDIGPISEAQQDRPPAPAGNGSVGVVGIGPSLPEKQHTGEKVVIVLHLGARDDVKRSLPPVPGKPPVGVRVIVQNSSVGLHVAIRNPALRIKEGPVDHHISARPLSDLTGSQRLLLVRHIELDPFHIPQRHRHNAASHFRSPQD